MSTEGEVDAVTVMTRRDEPHRRGHLKHQIEVSVHVDASPDAVWDVIADVTRGGEWSGESCGCEWLDGATRAEPGARFRGRNRRRGWRWNRINEVASADRPRGLVWRTLPSALFRDSTEWRIALEPDAGGTRVSEEMQVLTISRPMEIALYWCMPVHRDRTADLLEDLRRLKAVVEAGQLHRAQA
ncbi:MAG: SRPBCC family protein [Chloroflexota bacterium]